MKKIFTNSSNKTKFILLNDYFFEEYININNKKTIQDVKI